MKQHTGNWAGKTVATAAGEMKCKDAELHFIDLPGTYSLSSSSPDEKAAGDYIKSGKADIILVVADATCLERNLLLVNDVLKISKNVILCVNLIDEAAKKGIVIDIDKLQLLLKIPVIPAAARSGEGLDKLVSAICEFQIQSRAQSCQPQYGRHLSDPSEIYNQCVSSASKQPHSFDRKLDKIATSKLFGFPLMILMLVLIFWITMVGANYPSSALSAGFSCLGEKLRILSESVLPPLVSAFLMDGIYTTLTWVISVMLPPMAIFFPLFTLLEDFGYLPRVAFNLDSAFKRCGAHGKQALTTCMGFGCNACGVMGCRIIESPRERLIAILTNNFVPCNGRFPTLISIILIFFAASFSAAKTAVAGIMLTAFIIIGIAATLMISKLLSNTILKGIPSSFVLELPPYRKPKLVSVIVRSVFDRTIFVLARAVVVAAPAGAVIWLLANINAGESSLLNHFTDFLQPFGSMIGVDGVIVAAFILGFPANEIVIPVMLMCYMSTGILTDYSSLSQLQDTLISCGWTSQTAVSVLILCLFHFPCGTTCLTIKKETGSLRWTALAFVMPTILGILLCFIINMLHHMILLCC